MKQVFAAHFSNYPGMEPRDAVKLAYQSTYGGGHLVSDPATALARLKEELAAAPPLSGRSLLEDIGGGRKRLHLNSPDFAAHATESVAFLFSEGAKAPDRGPEALDPALDLLRDMALTGEAPFSSEALEAFLTQYEVQGRPAVSHSEAYRAAYHPAYRVMEDRLLRFLPLLDAIDGLLNRKDRVTVAVDGMSAAGKSTLGDLLVKRYGCNLIHMDDFFLPPELRTPERFAAPGGNVHYERFRAQVLAGLVAGKPFSYNRFDCHTMSYAEEISVRQNRLTVVEGAYALHPSLRDFYDLKVFYPVEPDEQLRRIRLRNGESCMVRFRDKWIPLENTYIAACGVRECCDLIL